MAPLLPSARALPEAHTAEGQSLLQTGKHPTQAFQPEAWPRAALDRHAQTGCWVPPAGRQHARQTLFS